MPPKYIKERKLGRITSNRIAMLRNMAASLFRYEEIRTTIPKAKELRRFVEKIITKAKKGGLYGTRSMRKHISDPEILKKISSDFVPRFKDRHGGYVRILRTGFRASDGAEMGIVKFS